MTKQREEDKEMNPEVEQTAQAAEPDQPVTPVDTEESAAEAPEPEEDVELTAEEILRAERDEFEGKWLRVVAELDNVRKRSRREIADSRRFAQADILRSLLDVQDNFERALQSTANTSDTDEPEGIRAGIELIFQNFRGLLKDKGVEPIEALGTEFNPNVHEAVGQIPREGVEPGQVIEVVQQGFHFGDMVLRPARVIISS